MEWFTLSTAEWFTLSTAYFYFFCHPVFPFFFIFPEHVPLPSICASLQYDTVHLNVIAFSAAAVFDDLEEPMF